MVGFAGHRVAPDEAHETYGRQSEGGHAARRDERPAGLAAARPVDHRVHRSRDLPGFPRPPIGGNRPPARARPARAGWTGHRFPPPRVGAGAGASTAFRPGSGDARRGPRGQPRGHPASPDHARGNGAAGGRRPVAGEGRSSGSHRSAAARGTDRPRRGNDVGHRTRQGHPHGGALESEARVPGEHTAAGAGCAARQSPLAAWPTALVGT